MGNKNLLISFLQVWGILLVVIGHSFQFVNNESLLLLFRWIYSFHMALFMFISGYLLRYSAEYKGKSIKQVLYDGKYKFLIKKVKRLIVPYVIISTLAFFPKVLLSHLAERPLTMSLSSYIHMLLYPWDNVIIFFWFLPTLFIIFCIVYILGNGKYNCRLQGVIILCLLLILHIYNPVSNVKIFNISGVAEYLFYFALGYYACRVRIEYYIKHHPLLYFIITSILSIVLLSLSNFIGRDILTAVNGIIMSIALGYLYIQNDCTFFNHLYGASFAIYLFSWFPQVFSQQILVRAICMPWYVATILAILSGIYIPLIIYRYIMKYKTTKTGRIVAFITGH